MDKEGKPEFECLELSLGVVCLCKTPVLMQWNGEEFPAACRPASPHHVVVNCLMVKNWNSRLSSDLCMCTHTHADECAHITHKYNVRNTEEATDGQALAIPSTVHVHLHILYTWTGTHRYKNQKLALIRRKSFVSSCFWLPYFALLTFFGLWVYVYWDAGFMSSGTSHCHEDEVPANTQQWLKPRKKKPDAQDSMHRHYSNRPAQLYFKSREQFSWC